LDRKENHLEFETTLRRIPFETFARFQRKTETFPRGIEIDGRLLRQSKKAHQKIKKLSSSINNNSVLVPDEVSDELETITTVENKKNQ
jgi:hypothetical protein